MENTNGLYGKRNSALTLAFLMMFVNFIGLQFLSPLLHFIKEDVPMTNTQMGFITSAYMFSGIFMSMLLSVWMTRIGQKPIMLLGNLFLVLGLTLFGVSSNYTVLILARFICGIGATVTTLTAPLLINQFFRGGNISSAFGVYFIAPPLGAIVALNLFSHLGGIIGWRACAFIVSVLQITVFLAILFFPVPRELKPQSYASYFRDAKKWLFPAIKVAAISFAIGSSALCYNVFSPAFYQAAGYGQHMAAFIVSLFMGLNIFFNIPIGNLMGRKQSRKRLYCSASAFFMGICFLILPMPFIPKAPIGIILGIISTAVPLAAQAILPDIVDKEYIASGLAIVALAGCLGQFISPVIFGGILDMGWGYQAAYSVPAALMFMVAWLWRK